MIESSPRVALRGNGSLTISTQAGNHRGNQTGKGGQRHYSGNQRCFPNSQGRGYMRNSFSADFLIRRL